MRYYAYAQYAVKPSRLILQLRTGLKQLGLTGPFVGPAQTTGTMKVLGAYKQRLKAAQKPMQQAAYLQAKIKRG